MAKPTLKHFMEAVKKCGGNITQVAKGYKVSRSQVHRWIQADPSFKEVVKDARMELFDECLVAARIVARGIPMRDENGMVVGWAERPDSGMLRYIMGCLGKEEGFGDSVDVTSGGEKVGGLTFQLIASKEDLAKIDEEIPDIPNEYSKN